MAKSDERFITIEVSCKPHDEKHISTRTVWPGLFGWWTSPGLLPSRNLEKVLRRAWEAAGRDVDLQCGYHDLWEAS